MFTAFAPEAALGVVALSNSTRSPDRAAIGLLRHLLRAGSTRSGHLPDPRKDSSVTDPSASLKFSDRRRHGAYDVTDSNGVVARIAVSWTGNRFTATDARGAPLCAAWTSWWRLPTRWDATGPDGSPLLTARMRGIAKTRAEVDLQRGDRFLIQGSTWRRDFRVTGEHGEVVLTAAPRSSVLSLRPHDYAVQRTPGTLQLAEVVALVQIWRATTEEESATTAGGAVAGGAAVG